MGQLISELEKSYKAGKTRGQSFSLVPKLQQKRGHLKTIDSTVGACPSGFDAFHEPDFGKPVLTPETIIDPGEGRMCGTGKEHGNTLPFQARDARGQQGARHAAPGVVREDCRAKISPRKPDRPFVDQRHMETVRPGVAHKFRDPPLRMPCKL